jgi:predicted GTPase
MSGRRLVLVAALALSPFLALMAFGSYHLYATGWGLIAWWPMAGCLTLAYGLGWYWTRGSRARLLPRTGVDIPPATWTDLDRQAWQAVERKAAATTQLTPQEAMNAKRYADTAIELALEVARVYHPDANDPFGQLTLPEILTCAELVARNLNDRVNKYVPGSHLFRVDDWKSAKRAVDWGKTALDVSWFARAVVNPINTGLQYIASRASGSILDRVQSNVLLWFHTAFVHELGKHLIELNSGRLKVGADKHRELVGHSQSLEPDRAIVVAIVGAAKAGKSSLVNALLGELRARTDELPVASGAKTYQLRLPDLPGFELRDTCGYGIDGPQEREVRDAVEAAESADLILFVGHARTAARAADRAMLDRLDAAFRSKPHLRFPPTVVALTHVDLLSPAMEWDPPYDWESGTRLKEVQIREAVACARQDLGDRIQSVVPVCSEAGREWNVRTQLAETLAGSLDEARGTAILKALHELAGRGSLRKTLEQSVNAGREAVGILWQSLKR